MRKKFFCPFFVLIYSLLTAQRTDNFIVLANKDSIICTNLVYEASSNGRLKYLRYKTLDGKTVEYSNRFKVPKLDCFCYGKQVYEMIPRRTYRQKKRNIVGKRLADGAITYCYFNNVKLSNVASMTPGESGMRKTGFSLKYVRIKDGKYIKLKPGTMRRKIKPVLTSCDQFVREYKGNYSVRFRDLIFGGRVVEMFDLYNRLCPNNSK